MFSASMSGPTHFIGLRARLVRSELSTIAVDAFAEPPLVVCINSRNVWFLNLREVSPSELQGALRYALARRASSIVYFDADPTVRFMDAIAAMDVIQATQANIILITPKTKSQTVPPTASLLRYSLQAH